jgi:hypothetical protein
MVAQLTGRPSLDADDEAEKAGYEAWLATLPAEQRPLD